ncbi:hypothetical protein [Azotobacter salinestris]|uniref:hypothetical protein n=1 Tax=Azotobacter salinestris TaxID=69964 RepID=UPI0032DFEE90
MSEKTYPYTAWVLMTSFKPKEVTIIQKRGSYEEASNGKWYSKLDLYKSKGEAIAAARKMIKEAQAGIDKRQENLNKKIAALDKAERGESHA